MIEEKNEIVEYSISPSSGRIKKKIRYRKKRSFFSGKRMKKYLESLLLMLLVIVFILSVVMLMRPDNENKDRMKIIDKKGVER